MLDDDQLAGRNAQLRDTLDGLMRELKQRTDGLKDAQAAISAMSGYASSPDGTVTAKVDSTGVLDELELTSRAFERTTPEQLARTITQVIRKAAGNVREQVQAEMAPLTSDANMVDLPDLVPGAPSLRDIFKVEQRDEPVPPPPPSDDDYGNTVLRREAAPPPPAARRPRPPVDDDGDFSDEQFLGRNR